MSSHGRFLRAALFAATLLTAACASPNATCPPPDAGYLWPNGPDATYCWDDRECPSGHACALNHQCRLPSTCPVSCDPRRLPATGDRCDSATEATCRDGDCEAGCVRECMCNSGEWFCAIGCRDPGPSVDGGRPPPVFGSPPRCEPLPRQ